MAVAGRLGRQRLWDLAERVYPADKPVVPADEARKIRDEKWLRSLGVARPKVVGDAGIPVEIEGNSDLWRVDPEATAAGFEGRTALLSPFDRLIHDRDRALELFDFEYALERSCSRRGGVAPASAFGYQGSVVHHESEDPDYLTDSPNRRCRVIAKARTELAYDPQVTLADGLWRSLLWYRDNAVPLEP